MTGERERLVAALAARTACLRRVRLTALAVVLAERDLASWWRLRRVGQRDAATVEERGTT